MKIGFLGGTGSEAEGLALRFAAAGASILIGSRLPERAQAAARRINTVLGQTRASGFHNFEMIPLAEVVFLTVPGALAVAAVESCREVFVSGQVLVDVTVPVSFSAGKAMYNEPACGSNAELIAGHVPDRLDVVAAFKTIPARLLAQLDAELDCDVFICGNSRNAKNKVEAAVRLIPSLRAVDAGALEGARILERMSVLAIELNRRNRIVGARFRVIGL